MLYRPDAGALIPQMQAAYRALPSDPLCGNSAGLITPDLLLHAGGGGSRRLRAQRQLREPQRDQLFVTTHRATPRSRSAAPVPDLATAEQTDNHTDRESEYSFGLCASVFFRAS
jgi:hypothetical protein